MNNPYDLIIIGAGVVGSMVARFLSKYQLNILLLEKESDVCMGASNANSAIVHAGYDPLPGTLKAEMNVQANAMWDSLSGELNCAFERRGDYVVAIGLDELPLLDTLLEQGRKNGVPGMHIISGEEMRRREYNIHPDVSGALWAPTGGICDPFQVTLAAAENAVQNGVQLLTETMFTGFLRDGNQIIGVQTNRGDFKSRWVVNAAGLNSDVVMHQAGVRPDFKITPRRGEYFVLDHAEININNVLFPCPSKKGKGILVTTTLHGNTIIGPNSVTSDSLIDRPMTREGMAEIWDGALKLVPGLQQRFIIASFAGLRATGNARSENPMVDYHNDFVIEIPKDAPGLVNLGGIESPGLTSAPAIALRVIDLMQEAGENFTPKPDWNPIRPARPRFRELNREEQIKLIRRNPTYARMICRCEMVTEGEILAEIRSIIPATTYDAIKRRTWLGTGRCLGSFDMPRVVEILSRELKLSPTAITKKGAGSEFLDRQTKGEEN